MSQSKAVAEELFECYKKTAANIVLYFQDEKKKEILNNLKDVVQKNYEMDAKLNMIEDIKSDILDQFNSSKITDKSIQKIIKDYEEAVNEIDVNLSDNRRLLQFNQQVESLLSDAAQSQESIENDNDDEELQLSGSINIIDPISKTRIKDPIKNIVCGHTYDRKNIMALLRVNKKTRCPMVGCKSNEYVDMANLRTDVVMKAYLQRNPA